ncbi:hypothetical protein ABPG77_010259 [Micractinium sp. CCAP 211/92]
MQRGYRVPAPKLKSAGFARRALPFDLAGYRADLEQGLDEGSQYCAWNASSCLLAVSSYTLHAVFVWEPRSRQLHKLAGEQPSQQAAGLWLLPRPIMQLVIAAAAGQRSEWLPMPDA